ncbi:hypothetical protein GQ44DRAFT_696434 [Phaeosphaeriaceae sp. PMI808]|nr:hypothetical protein GQ44DRAFT_696434 [Phaeosphaeriaceae sp. PMI808]
MSWDHLDFSRASRQLFAETAPLYYWMKLMPLTNGVRVLYDFYIANYALEYLTPSQIRTIQRVTVTWNFLQRVFESKNGLACLKGLRRVVVLDAPARVTRSNADPMSVVTVGHRKQGLEDVVFDLVVRC